MIITDIGRWRSAHNGSTPPPPPHTSPAPSRCLIGRWRSHDHATCPNTSYSLIDTVYSPSFPKLMHFEAQRCIKHKSRRLGAARPGPEEHREERLHPMSLTTSWPSWRHTGFQLSQRAPNTPQLQTLLNAQKVRGKFFKSSGNNSNSINHYRKITRGC